MHPKEVEIYSKFFKEDFLFEVRTSIIYDCHAFAYKVQHLFEMKILQKINPRWSKKKTVPRKTALYQRKIKILTLNLLCI